jgi:ATP-dependent helicase HrpA
VVIVCGETGSGKTTQIAENLPRTRARHHRPDRPHAAAPHRRALDGGAHRAGTEERARAGVGYKIRFHDRTSPQSYIKLMTDGILLAETQGDPWLASTTR